MPEKGLVTNVSGNMISVKMFPLSSCGTCTVCDARKRSELTIEIENTCNAKIGGHVSVEMGQSILAGALIFYGIPLLAFAVGILLGAWIGSSFTPVHWKEPMMIILGISFLLISYGGIRLADWRIRRYGRFPTATAILSSDEDNDDSNNK